MCATKTLETLPLKNQQFILLRQTTQNSTPKPQFLLYISYHLYGFNFGLFWPFDVVGVMHNCYVVEHIVLCITIWMSVVLWPRVQNNKLPCTIHYHTYQVCFNMLTSIPQAYQIHIHTQQANVYIIMLVLYVLCWCLVSCCVLLVQWVVVWVYGCVTGV